MDGIPSIFAVIPVHNRVEQTLRCLGSLQRSAVPATAVVVDDGSTDGTREKVLAAFPQTVVLRGDGHLWWGGATNRGVRHALANGADYVLTLNNDGVIEREAIGRLLDTARTIPNALVAARRNDLAHPARTWSDGWMLTEAGCRLALAVAAEPGTPTRIDAAGANLLLIGARCFAEVGLFDAVALPQCFCDWDFQLRAAQRGWTVYCEPRAVVLVDRATATPTASGATGLRRAAFLLTSTRSGAQPVYLLRYLVRHRRAGRAVIVAGRIYLHLAWTVVGHYWRAAWTAPPPRTADGASR